MSVRYRVVFSKLADEKFSLIVGSDRKVGEQIAKAIDRLSLHPERGEFLKGPLQGCRKYRSGDYRIIYRVENEKIIVFILTLGHRKEIYDL